MSPAPTCYWCDFCKEWTLIPHTLEYNYKLPSPTPVTLIEVAAGSGLHGGNFNLWFLNKVAVPMHDAMKVEEQEAVVTGPGIGVLDNPGGMLAARCGVQPYNFIDTAGPLAPPPAAVLLLPRSVLGMRRPLSSSRGGDPSTGCFLDCDHTPDTSVPPRPQGGNC
jgi:hypothetical protein